MLRGFRQFDAPVSIILPYDRVLDPGATCHFDLGALGYGIVLAAWNRGLGAVTNGQGIARSDIVREITHFVKRSRSVRMYASKPSPWKTLTSNAPRGLNTSSPNSSASSASAIARG